MLKTLSKDEITILNLLEEDSGIDIPAIARRCDLVEEEVSRIVQSLEKDQILIKYKAIINWEKIESPGVVAVIQVNVTPQGGAGYDDVARKISSFEEVNACLLVSGSFDLLVEVEGPSLKEVAFFVSDKLAAIEGVEHTKTNFLLKRYKEGGDIFSATSKTHRLPVVS